MNIKELRKPEFPVDSIFIYRWSPRAMSGEVISKGELMPLFEAAKWAPSSYNNQPWRFLYAIKDTVYWKIFFDLLTDFNKQWVKNAGALILVLSKKNFEFNNKPSITHRFDTGSAFENLMLQGNLLGYVVHAMEGFDYNKARKELNISDDYDIECMVAVGKPGKKGDLPDELNKQESPSQRKKINEIAFEGSMNAEVPNVNKS